MKSKGVIILLTTIILVIIMIITMMLCLFLRPISFDVECEQINVTYIKQNKKTGDSEMPEFNFNQLSEEGKQYLTKVLKDYSYYSVMFSASTKFFDNKKISQTITIDMYKNNLIFKTYQISNNGVVVMTKYEEEKTKQSFYKLKLDEEQMDELIKKLYNANF